MNTPAFATTETDRVPPDLSKHVNYTQGMVLGVDDFTQDFAYLENRDQWLVREAIGYGTVTGLHVSVQPKDDAHEIRVSPGVAISPRGQMIHVTTSQCATIESWLQLETTRQQLTERGIAASSSSFNAYVVLCYRDCPVDALPVPGEPCRCDSETMAASRIQDDFRLELTLQPPPQREEDAVRGLVEWLRRLPVHDFTPADGRDLDAFLNAIRAQDLLSLTTATLPSPPASPPHELRIPRGQLCEWLRAALRLWVTELREKWQEAWRARAGSCQCGGSVDVACHGTGDAIPEQGRQCLLLAQVTLMRSGGSVTNVTLDEEKRPFLLHLRMLQELLLCGRGRGLSVARTFGTAFTTDQHTIRLWLHYPDAVSVPEAALTLRLNDLEQSVFSLSLVHPNVYDLVLPGSPPDLLAPGVTIEIRLDAQFLLDPGGRDLASVFVSAGYRFNDYEEPVLRVFGYADTVPPIPTPNDAVIVAEDAFAAAAMPPDPGQSPNFARADHTHGLPPDPIPVHVGNTGAHANHTVIGDVTGTLAATFVSKLQGRDLDAPAPNPNELLQFVQLAGEAQGRWRARPLNVPGAVTPNDAVLRAENVFTAAGTPPNAGGSPNFARADHTHGLPPDPIPPHVANLTSHLPHQILGDITRTIGTTFISRLQDVRVRTQNVQAGEVLQVITDGANPVWVNARPNSVFHPPAGDYHIVAAGIIRVTADAAGTPVANVVPTYNQLRVVTFNPASGNRFTLTFGPNAGTPAERYLPPNDSFTYIVKGHSLGDPKRAAFMHATFQANGIRVEFFRAPNVDATIEAAMIEISMFGKF